MRRTLLVFLLLLVVLSVLVSAAYEVYREADTEEEKGRVSDLAYVTPDGRVRLRHQSATPNGGTVWPHPSYISMGSSSTTVALDGTSFQFVLVGGAAINGGSPLLQRAFARYSQIIFPTPRSGTLNKLTVSVASNDETLQLGVDESYSLSVDTSAASVNANTVWGALRALETFSQLVSYDPSGRQYVISQLPVAISDSPRFQWRGFLLDTSRHYYPVDFILHVIDSLAYNKFNTLHWHVVDAQSFPFVSQPYPALSQAQVWCATCVYSHSDVQKIVSYAKDRGVRVLPEFDTPGHSYSWGQAYPQLTAKCPSYQANVNNIPLNPALSSTYDFLRNFLRDAVPLFPDKYFHTGGDEVVYGCWAQDASITQFMSQQGWGSDYNKLMNYFEGNLNSILAANNRTAVVWQEVFGAGVTMSPSTIVEAWISQDVMYQAIQAGYFGLLAAGWYLDKQIPGTPTHYEWEDTWINFYLNDPIIPGKLTPSQEARVLGGEACMWSEQVNATNFDVRVWPRASAVAERLWSPSSIVDLSDAKERLTMHTCRLANRGIASGPIQPDYCPPYGQ